jgi:general secretion pathway protein K
MRSRTLKSRQRGIALLTAILLVALGTILATGIAYQNAMTARRGTATFAFDQSLQVAEAAEALAAYALAQDMKDSPNVDTPSEAWAKPFGPVEVVPGVALEAKLEDANSRFNLNSLVGPDGKREPNAVAEFKHLLQLLELEEKWASLLVDWIDRDHEPEGFDGAEDSLYTSQTPAYRTPDRPITSISELLALPGFGRDRYLKLAPHVVALPQDAKVNICTAGGIVVDALTATANTQGRVEFSGPDSIVNKARSSTGTNGTGTGTTTTTTNGGNGCALPKDTFLTTMSNPDDQTFLRGHIEEKSNYFRLTSIVTVGNTQFALYSLLYRNGGQVRPIMRSFSAD